MVRVSVSRTIKASRSRVWDLIADLENWPKWAPSNAKNRVLSHTIVTKEGNVVVCDEYEQAGLIRARHRDRYTLHPDERLDEEIMQGDFVGGIVLTLKPVLTGTLVHVDADVSPKKIWLRFLSIFVSGERALKRFWIDLFDQLAVLAESQSSPGEQNTTA